MYRLGNDDPLRSATFYDYVDTATFDAWTPKGSVQVQVSRDTFVYVSATRGFKSGGFNPTAPRPGGAFNPEFAWSYEGGVKHTMAGGRVHVNTAVFYNDYQDLQVQSFVRPGVLDISNAGSGNHQGRRGRGGRGAEAWPAARGPRSWLDATYDRYLAECRAAQRLDAAGHRLNNAPEWSGSGSAVYELATGRAGTASVRGDVSWQSRVFFTPANDAIETQRAVWARPPARRFRAAEPALGDSRLRAQRGQPGYITGTANVPLPAFTGRPGEPRHWGTQFTWRSRPPKMAATHYGRT